MGDLIGARRWRARAGPAAEQAWPEGRDRLGGAGTGAQRRPLELSFYPWGSFPDDRQDRRADDQREG